MFWQLIVFKSEHWITNEDETEVYEMNWIHNKGGANALCTIFTIIPKL